jgi:hypothetical protein
MMTTVRSNRLLTLGVLWGVLLAAVPTLVITRPYRLSGCVGTLAAGHRAARRKESGGVLAGLGTGLFQGLLGGAFAALLIWALMALTLAGFSLQNPVELATLMSPRIFLGSFFVALSVFVVAGGLLLGPAFGTLINRAVAPERGGP